MSAAQLALRAYDEARAMGSGDLTARLAAVSYACRLTGTPCRDAVMRGLQDALALRARTPTQQVLS